ncbi:MAG TPA: class I SAM-dependent methyltransferase [Prolixibacteraceae bacterium]|nr:class I SAM-dependent methyltransferase [Prolixibacteraceae bacterium]
MVESGWFYGTLVDPVLANMRSRISGHVIAGEKVLDVACGTGAQVFDLAQTASTAVGIDISTSMIGWAKKMKSKHQLHNTDFYVCDATNLKQFLEKEFDAAILSLALHQFNPELHAVVLAEMARVAKRTIIADYTVPLPKNYAGYGCKVAEFFAGKEHNSNFKKYCRLGGLNQILPANQYKIHHTEYFGKNAFQLVVCSPG